MGENNGGDAGSAVSQPPTKKSKAEPTVLEQEFDKAGFSYTRCPDQIVRIIKIKKRHQIIKKYLLL